MDDAMFMKETQSLGHLVNYLSQLFFWDSSIFAQGGFTWGKKAFSRVPVDQLPSLAVLHDDDDFIVNSLIINYLMNVHYIGMLEILGHQLHCLDLRVI